MQIPGTFGFVREFVGIGGRVVGEEEVFSVDQPGNLGANRGQELRRSCSSVCLLAWLGVDSHGNTMGLLLVRW